MKSILEFIFSAVVIAAIYFGYQFFTGKMTFEEIKFYLKNLSVESVLSKPYDCDTNYAQISALCLAFKGNSCDENSMAHFKVSFYQNLAMWQP